jgi:putative flippase GtrA
MRQLVVRFRGKALRYLMVSIAATLATQILLAVFVDNGWQSWYANMTAVAITSVPAFFANRAWVWGKIGDHSLGREFAPFWLMTLAGLTLSTVFVAVVDRATDVALAINLASIGGFGVLWVAKFVVLDEYLFSPSQPALSESVESAPTVSPESLAIDSPEGVLATETAPTRLIA